MPHNGRGLTLWNNEVTMAGKGKQFDFHGSFTSKAEAVKKEKEVGGFIREHKINGKLRYFVLTAKDRE